MILAACASSAPSEDVINTAIAQTQAANPTATQQPANTPSPSATVTITPTATYTPNPTPDIRLLDIDPRNLLLQKSDLPAEGRYYLPGANWTSPVTNSEIVSSWTVDEGKAYLAETGRIHGWLVYYQRGTNNVLMPEQVYDNVVLYSTSEGAQVIVTKYGARGLVEDGFKELDTPEIGDLSRAFQLTKTDASGMTKVTLYLIFSYRNVYHTLVFWGWKEEVSVDFAVNIANRVLDNLEQLPLSTRVEFQP
jgi:hypothetical protein